MIRSIVYWSFVTLMLLPIALLFAVIWPVGIAIFWSLRDPHPVWNTAPWTTTAMFIDEFARMKNEHR